MFLKGLSVLLNIKSKSQILMKYYVILSMIMLLWSCQTDPKALKVLFDFPDDLTEISGITFHNNSGFLWALQDHGNANQLYAFQLDGSYEKSLTIANATNRDWEDITTSAAGDIYIGDFGNNANKRQDLCIYKVEQSELKNDVAYSSYKIEFSYPEQTQFPPSKDERFYDVESFFEFQDNFYLFTKNRSKGFDGSTLVYKIPNASGVYKAELVGSFQTCTNYNRCAVTSVAISPEQNQIAVLTHDKIILFQNFKGDKFLEGKRRNIDLDHYSQKEGIAFKDQNTILIADERKSKNGGKLYQYQIAD